MTLGKALQYIVAVALIAAIIIRVKSNKSDDTAKVVKSAAKHIAKVKPQQKKTEVSNVVVSKNEPIVAAQKTAVPAEPTRISEPYEIEYENRLSNIATAIFPKGNLKRQGDIEGRVQNYVHITDDGKKVITMYNEGYLHAETLFYPNGEQESRGFYPDGTLRRLNLQLSQDVWTTINFDEEGNKIHREDRLPNGDIIKTEFEYGSPISKVKETKSGEKISL